MKHPNPTLKRFLAASALSLALPIAALANPGFGGPMGHDGPGGPMMGGRHHHGEPGVMPLLHRLNLTEAQQDKIFSIMHAQAPQMREQAKIAHKARTELHEMAFSDKYDEAKARALIDSETRAHAEMALMRIKGTQQIYTLLTPEQRKQAAELKAKHDEMRHDWGPGGMSMRPGDDGPRPPRMDRRPPPPPRAD